jgi:tetratricopeptide (TPR) repeat protein
VFWLNDIPSLRRYATDAMALARTINRDDLVAGALGALTLAQSSDGDLEAVIDLSTQALARAGDQPLGAVSFGVAIRGLNFYWLGRFDEALANARQSAEVARKKNDTLFIAYTLPHVGLPLAAKGEYVAAQQVFDEARQFSREHEIWPMLARVIAMEAGFHLDVFDYAGHASIAEEARELGRSANLLNPFVSASLDLLFNYIRCGEIGRAEQVVHEVAASVEQAAGSHGWVWRLRLAEARAELALVRGDAAAAVQLAEIAIAQSQARGRIKYQVFGLETWARALAMLNRKHDAIAKAQVAVDLARSVRSPALLLRISVAQLELAGNDTLLAEAQAAAHQIATALPNESMRQVFEAAEPVQKLRRLRY